MAGVKTWLVTGSSRGLGRKIAEAALAAGDRVAATARDPGALADLEASFPGQVQAIRMNVTDRAGVATGVAQALAAFGHLDIVVNSAGHGEVGAFEDVSADRFREQIEVNFFGVVQVTQAVLPHFRERGSGHIIQISAVSGRFGVPGLAADTAAKFAVEGLSEVVALEVAPLGIKVTLIEPGGVRTDWGKQAIANLVVRPDYESTVGALARYIQDHAGMEPGDPERCAAAIMRIARMEDPPLRLVLGREALEEALVRDAARARSDEHWRDLSESVDYPGTFQSTPLPF